ncbi:MAG: hypothetical protein AAF587_08820 [Bacteroidota bacterium]
MKLTLIQSTLNCETSACPTIYKDEAGNYIIQGFILKPAEKAAISIPEGEDAIRVPADFLQKFIEKMSLASSPALIRSPYDLRHSQLKTESHGLEMVETQR